MSASELNQKGNNQYRIPRHGVVVQLSYEPEKCVKRDEHFCDHEYPRWVLWVKWGMGNCDSFGTWELAAEEYRKACRLADDKSNMIA